MRYSVLCFIVAGSFSTLLCETSDAGWGGLLRKGASAASKGVRKAAPTVAPKAIGKEATSLSVKGVTRGAGQVGRKTTTVGVKGSRSMAVPGARVVVNDLGIEGGQLLGQLSAKSASQLAEISGEIARSPYRQQWLSTITSHGDKAVQWLWNRKGAIFVGTAATAIALKPVEFLAAMESASNAVTAKVAEHVVGPLAEEMAAEAASTFPWEQFWRVVLVTSGLVGCFGVWKLLPRR